MFVDFAGFSWLLAEISRYLLYNENENLFILYHNLCIACMLSYMNNFIFSIKNLLRVGLDLDIFCLSWQLMEQYIENQNLHVF